MIELIICDDDAGALNQTRQFLTDRMCQWHEEIEIMTYTDSDSLMKRIRSENERIDILLLDIDMPDISELIRSLIPNRFLRRAITYTCSVM